jgi:hypothetical protein
MKTKPVVTQTSEQTPPWEVRKLSQGASLWGMQRRTGQKFLSVLFNLQALDPVVTNLRPCFSSMRQWITESSSGTFWEVPGTVY